MSAREELIQIIITGNDKQLEILGKAIEMIQHGMSDDEIKAHFGIV